MVDFSEFFFFFQAEDGIRDIGVTGVQTCALPILRVQKRAWLPSPVADGPDEVRRLVRHVLMAGADFIKICATGGITSVTDSWDEPQFTLEEIQVAVAEAAMRKKGVAVH